MNKYTKQYISEVKALFPSKGKNERQYIKKLAITVDEFCEEESIKNKLIIYKKIGKPIDIVYDYYSALDTEAIVKKIRLAGSIRLGIVLLICIALIATAIYAIAKYDTHVQMEIISNGFIEEEEAIVTGRWDDNGYPLPLDYNPYADSESDTEPTESLK